MMSRVKFGLHMLSLCIAAIVTASLAPGEVIIHDFQDGTFGPWGPAGAPISAAVVADTEPDFDGDLVGILNDPDGGFQTIMSLSTGSTLALLPALHANNIFEWEVDSAEYGGDFLNNHLVFQTNTIEGNPLSGFNVLDGSARFMNNTTEDQLYSYNYNSEGGGEGRAFLNMIDPDQDGILAPGFTFFNIFVIQQVADGQSSTVRYDDFRLRVPEPATTALLAAGAIGLGAVRLRRKFTRS